MPISTKTLGEFSLAACHFPLQKTQAQSPPQNRFQKSTRTLQPAHYRRYTFPGKRITINIPSIKLVVSTNTTTGLIYLGVHQALLRWRQSPLYTALLRHKDFFDLFRNFTGYVNFFLLNDLVDQNGHIRFYLPFDQFKTPPAFKSVEDYLVYKERVMAFLKARNKRIADYVSALNNKTEAFLNLS